MNRAVWALFAGLVLAACGNRQVVRPDAPAPEVISVPDIRYVPINATYTARCVWTADGSILDIFDVSRGRKKCLEIYEAQFDAIRQVQGAPTP